MVKHISLALLRLMFAYVVMQSMAFAHARYGAEYPGGGQQADGFVLLFLTVGTAAALVYFVVGSVLQFLMRRRSVYSILLADASLCALFAGALAFAGATASYNQQSGSPKDQRDPVARAPSKR
jgi:hypothetical protein